MLSTVGYSRHARTRGLIAKTLPPVLETWHESASCTQVNTMTSFSSVDKFEDSNLQPQLYVCATASFDSLSIYEDDKEVDEASEVYVELSLFSRLIVESGLVTRKQFVHAGRLSSATGLPLGRALVIRKALTECRLATILDVCQRVAENTLDQDEALESLNFVLHHFLPAHCKEDSYHLPMRYGKCLEELLVKSGLLSRSDLLTAIEIGLVRQERLENTLVALGYVIEPALKIAANLQGNINKNEISFLQAVRCLSQIDWAGEKPTAEGLLRLSIVKGAETCVRLTAGGSANTLASRQEVDSDDSFDEASLTTTTEMSLGTGSEMYSRLMESCNRTAIAFIQRGDFGQAESVYKRMLAFTPPASGVAQHIQAISDLSDLLTKRGDDHDAAALLKQIISLLEADPCQDGLVLASYLSKLAKVYRKIGLFAESEPPLGHALLILEGLLPDGHADVVANLREYGSLLLILDRKCEAEKLFVQSHHSAS